MPKTKQTEFALHDWIQALTFQQQALLMTGMRGPDGCEKHNPAKVMIRYLRGAICKPAGNWSYANDNDFMWGEYQVFDYWQKKFFDDPDGYPHHFIMHLIHCAEVIGYKHPDDVIAGRWKEFYLTACKAFHMWAEEEDEMDHRLNDFGVPVSPGVQQEAAEDRMIRAIREHTDKLIAEGPDACRRYLQEAGFLDNTTVQQEAVPEESVYVAWLREFRKSLKARSDATYRESRSGVSFSNHFAGFADGLTWAMRQVDGLLEKEPPSPPSLKTERENSAGQSIEDLEKEYDALETMYYNSEKKIVALQSQLYNSQQEKEAYRVTLNQVGSMIFGLPGCWNAYQAINSAIEKFILKNPTNNE